MLLRRLGNKSKIAEKIIKYFPAHDIYIEPFFGAGGMFFNKRKAKYNIVNDLDGDVFNLFQVVTERNKEFRDLFIQMPVSEDLWQYWRKNKETDPLKKALRFIFLSNYGYMGKSETLMYGVNNTSNILLEDLERVQQLMFGVEFMNCDFRDLLKKISFTCETDKLKTLIYADPPYLCTVDNYSHSFNKQDSVDLFDTLQNSKCMFAMSEFDNEFIVEQAKQRNLFIHVIGERVNLKNRRVEIIITNFKKHPTLFDL